MFNNDRIYLAARVLATGRGDARERVVQACLILERLSNIDYQNLTEEVAEDIKSILNELGKAGPMFSTAETERVLINCFARTSYGRRNATYSKYAERIFLINERVNNNR